MTNLIISLSTTPPRMRELGPTLHDLLNQSANIKEIRLNIPRKYRRFAFTPDNIPPMPDGITVCIVPEDYGPATKVLPTVRDLRGENVEILFCDDDQHYDQNWAARFLQARKECPNGCIVEKGYDLSNRGNGVNYLVDHTLFPRAEPRKKGLEYRLFRFATLGARKRTPYIKNGYIDILEGYRGAMIRPDFIPEEAFEIPDVLWTVDDIWLSGQLTCAGVPIWLFADTVMWNKTYKAHSIEGLFKFVYKGYGRKDADRLCIQYFRENCGIWNLQNTDISAEFSSTPSSIYKPRQAHRS